MKSNDEPFPGYCFEPAASERADRAQQFARSAILEHGDGSLFDTEPQLMSKTLATLVERPGSET